MDVLSGRVWNGSGLTDGYVIIENGIITEVGDGKPPAEPTIVGDILPGLVDGHTHVADAGLVLDRKYGLEELVAPPNGLKHRYLNGTDDGTLKRGMKDYSERLVKNGVSRFFDFRENGVAGCKLLEESSQNAVVLGRPISNKIDINEVDEILDIADGIGIPSITDMDHRYIEKVADEVHKRKKILALHVSERIREDIDFVMSLEPSFVVHMTQATDRDMMVCADYRIPAVICARSNLYFDMVPPIKRMLDLGMTLAVGTDNAMLSSPDIFEETKVFENVLAEQGGQRSDALLSLIAGGKKLLYEGSAIGVQSGKRADLVVIQHHGDDSPPDGRGCVRYGP